MRVFVTGATGFVGSAVISELIQAGHHVLGLARSDESAETLTAAGAKVHRGDIEDAEALRSGAAAADAVIHTAFIHDFSRFQEVCEVERRAIEALGSALAGSDRALIVTSGTALLTPGQLATEDTVSVFTPDQMPRVVTEQAAQTLVDQGVRVSLVRLSPSVHGDGDHGFVPTLIQTAREKGVSAYVREGANRWSAVHRLDAPHLFRLVLEKGSGAGRYHAVAEESISFRDIAAAVGERLGVPVVSKAPEEAADHFGWFAPFATLDCPASSRLTQERVGWRATQPGLLANLGSSESYFRQ